MTRAPRLNGVVIRLVELRGFGFIRCPHDHADYFFHRSSCADYDALAIGQPVTFRLGDTGKGPRAEDVSPA